MNEAAKGVAAMVAACTIWGLSPLYYKMLAHIPPIEILAHRTLWSMLFFAGVLLLQSRLGELRRALGGVRAAVIIGFAALMISTNWFIFIMSIQIGKATEASMGYYLFPLVAVVIGMVAFGEKLGRAQAVAVALAAMAVALLTYGLGVAPWIALILSISFGMYGLVKKYISVGPVVSVTGEVLLLSPIALLVLWIVHTGGDGGGAFGASVSDSALLAFSGPLTGTPLILFSYATRRVRMATVGLVQYLNPTLQFFCAVIVFGEPFGTWHAAAFALIWTALAIYSFTALRAERAARRARASSSAVATGVR
ncbi:MULTISPECIES: EamA family transporter RarD [Sediminimonas]|uniref:EamA family transporter RarD n=1 Tax=Sediminimonas TaxID=659427 RepID=UPI00047BA25B|nr:MULTISPECIES: EamA family transporter RarD [Sediminimonas]MDR9485698.1 EamA family transporter RarD [Sediminimonas sp.]